MMGGCKIRLTLLVPKGIFVSDHEKALLLKNAQTKNKLTATNSYIPN